jgi:NTE family protein
VGHAWHCGALEALAAETGWDPRAADVVVGTSAGAGVAAYLRGGQSAHYLYARLHQPAGDSAHSRLAAIRGGGEQGEEGGRSLRPQAPWLALRSVRTPWEAGVVLTGLVPEGRRSTAPIGSWAEELHGAGWPDDPLWMCAVDLATGRRVVFGRDADVPRVRVNEAVEASSAIPAVFRPVELAGRRYVDGAMYSPTNADLLADEDLRLDVVVVSSPMSASSGTARLARRNFHHLQLQREAEQVRAATGAEVVRFEPSDEVLAVIQVARRQAPAAMGAVARAARRSVAAHLTSPRLRERLGRLAA